MPSSCSPGWCDSLDPCGFKPHAHLVAQIRESLRQPNFSTEALSELWEPQEAV
jgi:hypothetical protein